MRVWLLVAALAGTAALTSPEVLRSALATSASALFEAAPFVLGGIVVSRLLRGRVDVAYLGCGCGPGPSARSLPAAAATWLVFGPATAAVRFIAAVAVARVIARTTRPDGPPCRAGTHDAPHLLEQLAALFPAAVMAGAAMQLQTLVDVGALAPPAQILAGALAGFTAAPCGLGAVAVAGAFHVRDPLAATAFLCVAGIADARTFASRAPSHRAGHDVLAYVLAAIALGIVGWHRGATLVHPAIAGALLATCVAAAALAVRYRNRRDARARFAPALMLLGALVAAPPPIYRATETTMGDLFAGERLTFTGSLTRHAETAALVRYAITCCRADAAPVVVRLARMPAFPAGTWLRVEGVVETGTTQARLAARRIERIAPPTDPFIYR